MKFLGEAAQSLRTDAEAAKRKLSKDPGADNAVGTAYATSVSVNKRLNLVETQLSKQRTGFDRFMAAQGGSAFRQSHRRQLAALDRSFGVALDHSFKTVKALDALNAAIIAAQKAEPLDPGELGSLSAEIGAADDTVSTEMLSAGALTELLKPPAAASGSTAVATLPHETGSNELATITTPRPILLDGTATTSTTAASAPLQVVNTPRPVLIDGTSPAPTPAPAYDLDAARVAMRRQTQLAAQVKVVADAETNKLLALKNVSPSREAWIAYGAEAGPAGRVFMTQRAALNSVETEMSRIKKAFDDAGGEARFGGAFMVDARSALETAGGAERALTALDAARAPAQTMANALRAQGIAVPL